MNLLSRVDLLLGVFLRLEVDCLEGHLYCQLMCVQLPNDATYHGGNVVETTQAVGFANADFGVVAC